MVARKQTNTRSSRGAIAKRRSALRADKDGDVSMDTNLRSKGGISKSKPPTGPASDVASRKPRSGMTAGRLKAELTRHVSSGAITSKGRTPAGAQRGFIELKVTGWTESKASTSADRGVSSLISWLEKKATLRSATKRPIRIKKIRTDDKELIISIPQSELDALLRLDQYEWAGTKITIEEFTAQSEDTKNTINMMRGVLERRYNPELKLLDLSALGQDADLKASAIFDSRSTTSKFFPALMKVLEKQFSTPAEKHEAIQSVTLANNDLPNVSTVTVLASTLPQLKNLDISNNQLSKISDIEAWRRKFPQLDHLVITNNPVEQNEAELAKTLVGWYPKLRLLNTVQVRTDEEAAKSTSASVVLPFPIRSPVFQDEGQIAENFIRTFFTGFDSDRAALARMYYDADSDFSFAINTAAPRDPQSTDQTEPQEWEAYIKRSRNMKKISHLPARQARLSKGPESIIQNWTLLPVTRHPDLAAEANKWLIECQLQPGLPDPSGQSPGGVDGFLITIHGEFEEMDVSTGQAKKKRSFDRTFIIGPGGPSGVRVINDMLSIRAYGGVQAFEPEEESNGVEAANTNAVVAPPAGLTPEVAEQMVLELQKQTSMTVGYAKDCLDQVAWDFEKALQAFAAVRANLPPDAFVQNPTAPPA